MSEQQPVYKPGDVVNGHVLHHNGEWHPAPPAAAVQPEAFGAKYKRRWLRTVLVVGALSAVVAFFGSQSSNASESIGTAVGGFIAGGLLWGSVVNLVVASFK